MPRFLNSLHGIVWSIKDETMEILLPRGGKISAKRKKGIHVGQHVAFIMDSLDREVIDILPKEKADEQVKRGSNHIFDAASREPPDTEEEDEYGEYWQPEDELVFWCPGLT
jgi:hypothetical protein